MTRVVTIGVSLKTYFDHARGARWIDGVARVAEHPAIRGGAVRLFVLPTFLQLSTAVARLGDVNVLVGAQDVSTNGPGPFTGEVTAAEIAAVGGRLACVGHAERRRRHGETDVVVAEKARSALASGLTPVVCVGEQSEGPVSAAVASVDAQVRAALAASPDGEVVVAYEPVWAIGAPEPAPVEHVRAVTLGIRDALQRMPGPREATIIYGGAAGPGMLERLGDGVDGLFLGRFAHDLANLAAVVDEAAAFAGGGPFPAAGAA